MTQKAPGKSHRQGITLMELADMFPDEQSAVDWFETVVWGGERRCGHCEGTDTYRVKSGQPMPYRCRECKRYFSVKTGTLMGGSPLPIQKWVYAIYLDVTSLKGVSSMKLHRDIGVCQKTAWFMQQRIREAFAELVPVELMAGPIEVDETYVGGLERNKHANKRLGKNHWQGKTAVVGARDRATGQVAVQVVDRTDSETLQGFVEERRVPNAPIYTDGAPAYDGLENRSLVRHSVGEYVRGQVHTNGVESFWSTLKRAHKGVFHRLSAKHLQRYANEFAGRHNIRNLDTADQMAHLAAAMVGHRLMYRDLVAGSRGRAT